MTSKNDDIRISDHEISLLTPRENKTLANYLIKKSRNAAHTVESVVENSRKGGASMVEERDRAIGGSAERITPRPANINGSLN